MTINTLKISDLVGEETAREVVIKLDVNWRGGRNVEQDNWMMEVLTLLSYLSRSFLLDKRVSSGLKIQNEWYE